MGRRKVEGPKLLAEVHKDAMQQMSGRGRGGGGRRGDRGGDYQRGGNYSRGSPRDHNQLFQDDGFVEYSKRPQSGLSGRPNAMPTRLAPANFLRPNFKNRGEKDSSSPRMSKERGNDPFGRGSKDQGDRPKSGRGEASG